MLNHLFIDSLNALASELEANVFHLLTRSRKISEKMETLTMELLSFKCQVYSSIARLIGNWQGNYGNKNESFGSQTIEELKQEITVSNDKLFRYRLHHILKNKAGKKRRESMLASSLSSHEDQGLMQLQKSILLIEKDLGIEAQNDENQKLEITRIINNSLFLGLDSTPISKIGTNDYSIISETGSISVDLTSQEIQQNLPVSLAKQNHQENNKSFQPQSKTLPITKKMIIVKKKKRNVEKSDLLGNLLEETYSQCLDQP